MMTEQWWAPYLFIAIAGWLATDLWRWLGVLMRQPAEGGFEALYWVRAVATALVMAVTAKLIVFPTGTLEASPLWLRIGAAALGFTAFLAMRPTRHCRRSRAYRTFGSRVVCAWLLVLVLSEY